MNNESKLYSVPDLQYKRKKEIRRLINNKNTSGSRTTSVEYF